MKNKVNIFIFSSIFYLIGIFLNNFLINKIFILIVLFLIGLFFAFLYYKTKKYLDILVFSFFAFIIGIIISSLNLEKINENNTFLENYNDKVEIISEIKYIKEKKDGSIAYKAKIISINGEKPKNNIFSETIINDKYEELKKGQIIKNEAKIYFYKDFGSFSYKNYMISNGYYFKNYANRYERLGKNNIFKLEKNIINFREYLLKIIKENYPENEAIFLGGILLGAREELPKELKENFNNSGLTHFIAVSGFNITILILFVTFFIKYLPKKVQIISMFLVISLFVLLVGFSAPVIRAAIMGFIGYLVIQNGRKGNILAISLLTLVIMITLNPFSINYDVSLHLSFLAVFGIIYSQNFFNNLFKFLPNFLEIKTAVSITFSALLFTFPVMMFGFGQVSIIAPLTNLLVSWSIPIAMLFGSLSLVGFIFFDKLGFILGFLTYLFLKWNIEIVNFFGSLNYSVFKISFGEKSGYLQIIYLIIIIFIILYFKKEKKE